MAVCYKSTKLFSYAPKTSKLHFQEVFRSFWIYRIGWKCLNFACDWNAGCVTWLALFYSQVCLGPFNEPLSHCKISNINVNYDFSSLKLFHKKWNILSGILHIFTSLKVTFKLDYTWVVFQWICLNWQWYLSKPNMHEWNIMQRTDIYGDKCCK